jgi:DNA-directed RNA polymerase subunit RPC12/RpoP
MTTQTPVWTQIDADGTRITYFHAKPYSYNMRRFTGDWMILAIVEGDCEWWTIESGNVERGLSEVQAHYAIDGQTAYLSVFRHEPVGYLCPTCTTIGEEYNNPEMTDLKTTDYRCPACSHCWTARSDA